MDFEDMNGKAMRNLSLIKSRIGNISIKNLDKTIDSKLLYDTFSAFGSIMSCKVVCDENGSKGYGFVHFETRESAQKAIDSLNGKILNDQRVFIEHTKSSHDREPELVASSLYTNVYIKNFGENMDNKQLKELFSKYGPTRSVKVMTDQNGTSKGFGFVSFEKHEDALKAVNEMNGKDVNGKAIYVGRAEKKLKRQAELRKTFEEIEQKQITRSQVSQDVNLYIKNLADCIDDHLLHQLFSSYGTIISAKVMMEGRCSKGVGFVCFSAPEEATKAVTEMNGRIVASKPLHVTFAQCNKDRLSPLANQFMQKMDHIRIVPNQVINTYQPPPPPSFIMPCASPVQNHAGYYHTGPMPQVVPSPSCTPQRVSAAQSWLSVDLPVNTALPARVLTVISPDLFYVFPKENRVDVSRFHQVMMEIHQYCSAETDVHNYRLSAGDACCAKFAEDGQWYRAVILQVQDSSAKIAYADYGNVEVQPFSSLLPMKKSFLELPMQLTKCCLADVLPVTEQWSPDAAHTLSSLILGADVLITASSLNSGIYSVSVEKQQESGVLHVAKRLVADGLARNVPVTRCPGKSVGCCCGDLLKRVEKLEEIILQLPPTEKIQ